MAWQHLIWPQFTDVLLKLLVTCTVSVILWLAPGAEEWASEKSSVWCGRKDILHLKRNSCQEKKGPIAAVVSGVANPSPSPALTALNIFKGIIHPKITQIPSFIFGTQIKIFLMKSESFLTLHRPQCNWNVPRPRNKDIGKTVHVTSVAQLQFCEATRIRFVHKENKNNDFIQEFFSELPSSTILESTTTHASLRTKRILTASQNCPKFPKMSEGLTDLEWYEVEQLMTIFILGWTIPLTPLNWEIHCLR